MASFTKTHKADALIVAHFLNDDGGRWQVESLFNKLKKKLVCNNLRQMQLAMQCANENGFITNKRALCSGWHFHVDHKKRILKELEEEAKAQTRRVLKAESDRLKAERAKMKGGKEAKRKAELQALEDWHKELIIKSLSGGIKLTQQQIADETGLAYFRVQTLVRKMNELETTRPHQQKKLYSISGKAQPKRKGVRLDNKSFDFVLARMFDPYPAAVWHY